jgi:hypothetical protein
MFWKSMKRPYDPQEPVVCLDEKPVKMHAAVRPVSPAKPGREARKDNEYARRGTANTFCAVEPKAGRLDNLNIHRRKSLTDLLGDQIGNEVWDRFTVHYTPTHGSWLNQAEIEIGLLSRQGLGRRRVPDLATLKRAWNRRMNRSPIKINWKFDRKAARRKFAYKRKSFRSVARHVRDL